MRLTLSTKLFLSTMHALALAALLMPRMDLYAQAPRFLDNTWQLQHYPEEQGWLLKVMSEDATGNAAKALRKARKADKQDPDVAQAMEALAVRAREALATQLLVNVRSQQSERVSEQVGGGARSHRSTFTSNIISSSDVVLTGLKEERAIDLEHKPARLHVLVAVDRNALARSIEVSLLNELGSIRRVAEQHVLEEKVRARALGELNQRLTRQESQMQLLNYLSARTLPQAITDAHEQCLFALAHLREAQAGSAYAAALARAELNYRDRRWEACLTTCDSMLVRDHDNSSFALLRDRALDQLAAEVDERYAAAMARNEPDPAQREAERYLRQVPEDEHFKLLRREAAEAHFREVVRSFDGAAAAGQLMQARTAFRQMKDCTLPDPEIFTARREKLEELEVKAILDEATEQERDGAIEQAYRQLAQARRTYPSQEHDLRTRQGTLRDALYRSYKREVKDSKPPRYALQPAIGMQSAMIPPDSINAFAQAPSYSTWYGIGLYRRVGQRPRRDDGPRYGWKATLLGVRMGYLEGRYTHAGDGDNGMPAPFEPRLMGGISALLAETFLVDLGVSSSASEPFAWNAAGTRLQGSVALRLRLGPVHIDLATLGEWSDGMKETAIGFRGTLGMAINFSKSFNRSDDREVNARIDVL